MESSDQSEVTPKEESSAGMSDSYVSEQTSTHTVYSNNSYIDLNNADISVLFVHEVGAAHSRRTNPVRIVFSHSGFVQMAKFVQRYAEFLDNIYGGQVPSAITVDPKLLEMEFDKLHGIQGETNDGSPD